MILDLLTVFFLVTGFLLLIRLIRQRRRALTKIIIEERVREPGPQAIEASSFGTRDIHSEDLTTIIKARPDLISRDGLQEGASGAWPDNGRAPTNQTRNEFDLSKLISVLEAFASNNIQNGIEDHVTMDASTVKARPLTSSDPAEVHSFGTPAKRTSVETQTPESVLEHRNTIISADDDLAKMLRKIGPDS
jgi:hypothetical protein